MIVAIPDIETTILVCAIAPDAGALSVEVARALLDLRISDEVWIHAYERVGSLIGLLQFRARQTLNCHAASR